LVADVSDDVSETGVVKIEGILFPTFSLLCDVAEFACDDEDVIL
jgi:hypothetical protein